MQALGINLGNDWSFVGWCLDEDQVVVMVGCGLFGVDADYRRLLIIGSFEEVGVLGDMYTTSDLLAIVLETFGAEVVGVGVLIC